MRSEYPLYVGSRPETPNTDLSVRDKFTGALVARVPLADAATLERALAAAEAAATPLRAMRPYERQAVLQHCVRRFQERAEELAQVLCVEAGKPIRDSRGEVTRLIDTFRIAAEESVRIGGEVLNLEIAPRARGYRGMTRRVPIGPCSFIAPFNFPLNLAAHKIAPALAVGCPFLLKPASFTPISALLIGEVLAETALPPGAFSILPCRRDAADAFATDERIKLLSFTGSPTVGWALKNQAGKKRVVLELGGNAACVVDETADLSDAVARMLLGAFYQSGQSCISVQRILLHESIYKPVRDMLVEGARKLRCGNPLFEDTDIGPLITESDAKRLESWIQEAIAAGGRVLCGGKREGAMLSPTLLENVPPQLPVCAEEAFGPVAVLSRFTNFEQALRDVNASRYGLQAGLFTRDLPRAMRAWDELEVGAVVINDIPSWRVDHMPYGGVKDSGFGREGIRCAIEDMTEPRLLVIRDAPAC
jgi:acyl-CoA reductase-like NAD-dependent aldehyde dehydrogenase